MKAYGLRAFGYVVHIIEANGYTACGLNSNTEINIAVNEQRYNKNPCPDCKAVEHFSISGYDKMNEIEEYGQLYSGGSILVWEIDPEYMKVYPLSERIIHGQRGGGKVLRRKIIVIEDWEEVDNVQKQ